MFGFQPIPLSPEDFSGLVNIPPPPPPPPPYPCPTHDCNISLQWYTIPTVEIQQKSTYWENLIAHIYLYPYVYYLNELDIETNPKFCLEFELVNYYELPFIYSYRTSQFGISLDMQCATGNTYTAIVSVRPKLCPFYTPVTTSFDIHYYCNVSTWTTDPINISGSAGSPINIDLSAYVANKICNQTYTYVDDNNNFSQYEPGSPYIQTTFATPGNYTGSATVINQCQDVSANSVQISFNIT